MCTRVEYDGQSLASLDDLEQAGFTIEPHDSDEDWPMDGCLCGVDVGTILDRARVQWKREFYGNYHVEGPISFLRPHKGPDAP